MLDSRLSECIKHYRMWSRSIFGKIAVYNMLPSYVIASTTVSSFQQALIEIVKERCRNQLVAWHHIFHSLEYARGLAWHRFWIGPLPVTRFLPFFVSSDLSLQRQYDNLVISPLTPPYLPYNLWSTVSSVSCSCGFAAPCVGFIWDLPQECNTFLGPSAPPPCGTCIHKLHTSPPCFTRFHHSAHDQWKNDLELSYLLYGSRTYYELTTLFAG